MPQVPNHDPTPEEIKAACAEIQNTWTPAEARRRKGIFLKDERDRANSMRTVRSEFPEPEE